MDNPRTWRVVEQHFLNLPGFHAGAYVRAYVEDTRASTGNPSPYLELEISDCYRRIELEFCIDTAADRLNAFHKIETLIDALIAFRDGMAAEAEQRRRQEAAAPAAR